VLGGLALAPRPAGAQGITRLSAIPTPFSPQGDGVLDRTTFYVEVDGAVDSLVLEVWSGTGTGVWRMASGALAAGEYAWVWEGRTSGGATFPDGVHRLKARAYVGGAPADSAERLVSTDVTPPRVVNVEQIRSAFAPDASVWNVTGLRFGVETGGPAADTTCVRILNASGSPLLTLGGFSGTNPETTFYWNGRNSGGSTLAEGSYLMETRAADEAGNDDVEVATVYLDLGAPVVTAAEDTTFSTDFPVTLSGWARDASGVGQVFVRFPTGPWEDLGIAGQDSVEWTGGFGEAGDADGWYRVWVKARDIFGHESDSLKVVVGKASHAPVHLHSEFTGADSLFADGDMIEILTSWDGAGYTLRADFSAIDSKYVKGAEAAVDNGDSTYTLRYQIHADNSRSNASGLRIPIRATNVYWTDSTFVRAELWNAPVEEPEPSSFTLDQNLFDPEGGETLTIEFPETRPGSSVEIFTVVGERVWSKPTAGLTSVVWDGRNADGELVASGVYLVRLRDEVRKVGVVK
jgi:flagellar hook assembly protein FlgD